MSNTDMETSSRDESIPLSGTEEGRKQAFVPPVIEPIGTFATLTTQFGGTFTA